MNTHQRAYAGIDVGASRTKAVIIDGNERIVGRAVIKSGTDFEEASSRSLNEALEMAGLTVGQITNAMSTGYGRNNVTIATDTKTEISCHARGCYHYFPHAISIIDIGGQDNKIIKLDASGKRLSFKMNRKCAAGTGAFLEEMSLRLDIPLENLDGLARKSQSMVELGSFCTVFSATEVLEKIRQGKKVTDIVKGLFYSVIKRVMEMDSLSEHVVMTGGVVAHNNYLIDMTSEMIGRSVLIPEFPQLTGALGAALFAQEYSNER
jgi:predicted CoA-substrate-specific enzyme activase